MKDDDRIRNFMKKVKVTTSPEYTSLFPGRWPGRITIRLGKDAFEHEIIDPLGSPEQPMDWHDVVQKIKRVTIGILDSSQVDNLSAAVKRLRNCQSLNAFVNNIPVISHAV